MKGLAQIMPDDIEQHKSYLAHGLEALFLLTENFLFLLLPNTFFSFVVLDLEKGTVLMKQ